MIKLMKGDFLLKVKEIPDNSVDCRSTIAISANKWYDQTMKKNYNQLICKQKNIASGRLQMLSVKTIILLSECLKETVQKLSMEENDLSATCTARILARHVEGASHGTKAKR